MNDERRTMDAAVQNVIILGAGSAGLLAAAALKKKHPDLPVRIIRSKDIPIIGVGEGSTISVTGFLHDYLDVPMRQFFAEANPTWKLGLRLSNWGPRPFFNYPFYNTVDSHIVGLPRSVAFYNDDFMQYMDPYSAMMAHDRIFP